MVLEDLSTNMLEEEAGIWDSRVARLECECAQVAMQRRRILKYRRLAVLNVELGL